MLLKHKTQIEKLGMGDKAVTTRTVETWFLAFFHDSVTVLILYGVIHIFCGYSRSVPMSRLDFRFYCQRPLSSLDKELKEVDNRSIFEGSYSVNYQLQVSLTCRNGPCNYTYSPTMLRWSRWCLKGNYLKYTHVATALAITVTLGLKY